MKFCMNCGYKMAENVKFCPKCGAQQPVDSVENSDNNGADLNKNNVQAENIDQPVQNNNVQPQTTDQQPQNNNTQPQSNNHQSQSMNQQPMENFNNNQQQNNQNNYSNNFNNQYQTNFNNNQQNQQSFTMGQPQHLDFSQSLSYIWKNKFDFNPTVQDNQKSIFWWSQLILMLLSLVVFIVIGFPAALMGSGFGFFIMFILDVAFGLMSIPPIMRRLNYLGQSKNMAWLYFVPIAQFYILYLMLIDGSQVNHA